MILPDDKLREVLKKAGVADEKTLDQAAQTAKANKSSLQDVLTGQSPSYEEKTFQAIAQELNVPFVSLAKEPVPEDVLNILPEKVARSTSTIVFKQDDMGLHLASSSLPDPTLMTLITTKTGAKVIPHLTTPNDIAAALKLYKRDMQKIIDGLIKQGGNIPNNYLGEAPITKIVDTLISAAYQDRASDIHIEPEEEFSLIRFRIDGVLHDLFRMPKSLHDRVVTRIKVVSNLRTDEHLSAQDGKMRAELPEENLDIRVSILPIVEGEKVVLRLLSSKFQSITLSDLGMSERDLKITTDAFGKSFGMILSTGPTGAGKTTTIYAILKILNQREKNLTTIEDPVEYHIGGANQVQVNSKTNLTFANGLRSILRQDPNIIFVGEIRDGETADIAVNAALTGHLVFSTLHTNDAATAIPRLSDMGVEPFLVASTVNVIIAQRLVRKICPTCRYSSTITESDLAKKLPADIVKKHYVPVGPNKEIRIYQGRGCKICHGSGYLGRVGIFEVLEVTKKIRELITAKSDADAITAEAISDGMTTMLDDGLFKVGQGVTTVEEVLRVTKTEFLE